MCEFMYVMVDGWVMDGQIYRSIMDKCWGNGWKNVWVNTYGSRQLRGRWMTGWMDDHIYG